MSPARPWALLGACAGWWAKLARNGAKALGYALARWARLKRRST